MKKHNVNEGWTGPDGERAYQDCCDAVSDMGGREVMDMIWSYFSYEQLKKLHEWMAGDGYFSGIRENAGKSRIHVKRVDEMSSSTPYVRLDGLDMEVAVSDDLSSFSKQFSKVDTKKLYDFVMGVYNFTEADDEPRPDDRTELLDYVYQFAIELSNEAVYTK